MAPYKPAYCLLCNHVHLFPEGFVDEFCRYPVTVGITENEIKKIISDIYDSMTDKPGPDRLIDYGNGWYSFNGAYFGEGYKNDLLKMIGERVYGKQ